MMHKKQWSRGCHTKSKSCHSWMQHSISLKYYGYWGLKGTKYLYQEQYLDIKTTRVYSWTLPSVCNYLMIISWSLKCFKQYMSIVRWHCKIIGKVAWTVVLHISVTFELSSNNTHTCKGRQLENEVKIVILACNSLCWPIL